MKNEVYVLKVLNEKIRNREKLPCISDFAKELKMPYSTLACILIRLNNQEKIVYKRGKILSVKVVDIKGNNIIKKVEQHENKYSVNELKEKYDNCVKEVVCDYIKNIDSSAFNKETLNNILTNVTTITDKIKEKMFK